MKTPLLDTITSLDILRQMQDSQLEQLASELRKDLIANVSITGGHLGAGLGVVELTIALHKIFDTPKDKLIWDVGHQSYPHKILTGRRDQMLNLRKKNGLSGFTKRTESEYDPFGAAHSSTSISAGLGMRVAANLKGEKHNIIAVIGDGAMSAGMAYEAMNNAGYIESDLIVILNDNDMSIDRPVGAMSAYLARLFSSEKYLWLRNIAKKFCEKLPSGFEKKASLAEEYAKGFWTGGTLFEELGFYYIGPIDGHNFKQLLPVLRNIKAIEKRPVLLHVITSKGKGYLPAEQSEDKFHGVSEFNINTGVPLKAKSGVKTYTSLFSETLVERAYQDDAIVAITAAMPSGTGLKQFAKLFPKRFFDVGIAEQHAVTFAAGMAAQGLKPFVAIYSTFLQRAYDQIVHDVAIQKLPVRFAIDRAGLVGADGPTHAGAYDITFLGTLPNFILMAAADGNELRRMVSTAALIDDAPCAFRYPRGEIIQLDESNTDDPLEIGKGRIICQGEDVAILSYGARLYEAKRAVELLKNYNIQATLADARFAKPLDEALVNDLILNHKVLITIEEGAMGGFGSYILNHYAQHSSLNPHLQLIPMMLPDYFIDHASPDDMYAQAGLNAEAIVEKIVQKTVIVSEKNEKYFVQR